MPQFCGGNVLKTKQNFAVEMFCKKTAQQQLIISQHMWPHNGMHQAIIIHWKAQMHHLQWVFFIWSLPSYIVTHILYHIWQKSMAFSCWWVKWSFFKHSENLSRDASPKQITLPHPVKTVHIVQEGTLGERRYPDTLRYTERTGLMWRFRNWFQNFNFVGIFLRKKAFFLAHFWVFMYSFLVGWTFWHQSAWNFSSRAKIDFFRLSHFTKKKFTLTNRSQPFWTIKIRPGRQEGPGKVKIWPRMCLKL